MSLSDETPINRLPTYSDWLSFELPDLRDADDWDDAFGYGNVYVRAEEAPEVAVLVHVIAPCRGDVSLFAGWLPVTA